MVHREEKTADGTWEHKLGKVTETRTGTKGLDYGNTGAQKGIGEWSLAWRTPVSLLKPQGPR